MSKLSNIGNNFESYQQLITFFNEHKDKYFESIPVEIDTWFSANLCSALGGVLDKLTSEFNQVTFKHLDAGIASVLSKNDFLSYYGQKRQVDSYNTTIRFLKLKKTDGKFFNSYVVNELLARNELPKMTSAVKEKMAEGIYEMFINAKMHSGTDFIYTCGQFYPALNTIGFTITDTGIGFKKRVNDRFKKNLTATQAISWATKDRHTTKEDMTGGIGLALLKEFIDRNKGNLQIVSDDGFYQFDKNGEVTKTFVGSFPGSIVNLQFRTDDATRYGLQSEHKDVF